MEWFEAIILGLIQGLTEFLPVSSSGHLEIGKHLLGVETTDDLLFTTMVHAATVLSTIVVFRKQILDLLKGFFCGLRGVRVAKSESGKLELICNDQTDYLLKIAVSMIPVFVVGVFFKDQVESLFGSITVVGFALIMTAVLLFFSDYASKPGRKSIFPENTSRNGISYWQAFVVGLGQALAVVPGLSRSGTTISCGMARGFDREFAVKFSFLMSIPAVLGANILSLIDAIKAGVDWSLMPLYLVGVAAAAVSGYLAIYLLKIITRKGKFGGFAFYCWGAGLLTLILSLIK
jgi:undecaprenyl-diphosphatase